MYGSVLSMVHHQALIASSEIYMLAFVDSG
jgi:hypothetical protein